MSWEGTKLHGFAALYIKPCNVFIALHCFHPHQCSGSEELNSWCMSSWSYCPCVCIPLELPMSFPSPIADVGGSAVAVVQGNKFLAKKYFGIHCEVWIQPQAAVALPMAWRCSCSAHLCQLPELVLPYEEINCLMNEARCTRLCWETNSRFGKNSSQKLWKRNIKTFMEFILGNYR